MGEHSAGRLRPPAWTYLSKALLLVSPLLACQDRLPTPLAPAPRETTASTLPGGSDPLLPTTTDTDHDGLPDSVEETLLRQFRPVWYFDGQEFIYPISISQWGLATGSIASRAYRDLASLRAAALRATNGTMVPVDLLIVGNREDNAPVYVDAVPMPVSFSVDGKRNLVWLHYYLLFGDDAKLVLFPFGLRHRGDWEHVCVLVERGATGDRNRAPVRIHYHHHGQLTVAGSAYAWHADPWGARHPRVYVEAGAHGMYRNPGQGPIGPHSNGSGSPDDPLDNPLRFMSDHWTSRRGVAGDEKEILQRFRGRWGDSAGSPRGPLQYNSRCDHDYVSRPTSVSFRLSGC